MRCSINPNEIMFLDYINEREQNLKISDYWKYDYGINSQRTIQKFIDEGIITLQVNLEDNLKSSKVSELKEILNKYNLSTSGNKSTLIERLLENVPNADLQAIFNKKIYRLTEYGSNLIKNNYVYIINKNKHYNFSEDEIKKAYETLPKYSKDSDIIWHILNKKMNKFYLDKDWGLYSSILYRMGNLLFHEDRYLDALKYYIATFIIDLSGMGNNNYVEKIDSIQIAPRIIDEIKNLISLSECSLEDLHPLFLYNDLVKLPFEYYSREDCFLIFQDYLKDREFYYTNYTYVNPLENNPYYNYYQGFNDFDVIHSSADTIKQHEPNQSNQSVSVAKIGLGFCTGGLSLLFTGIRKNKKQ